MLLVVLTEVNTELTSLLELAYELVATLVELIDDVCASDET